MTDAKLPPHDIAAEEAILGSLLVDPDQLAAVAAIIEPADFYREKNRWVYEACLSIGEGLDQITVAAELSRQGRLDAVGGAGFFSQITERLPTSLHAEYYAGIVARLGTCRRVISAAGQIAAAGYEAGNDPLGKATEVLSHIKSNRQGQVVEPYANAEAMVARYNAPEEERDNGVPFGFRDVDAATGNMFGGEVIVFGAATGMGKTQFVMGVCLHNADADNPTMYVSSEMQLKQWNDRVVAMETGMDLLYVRQRRFTPSQDRAVLATIDRVSKRPVYFLPTSNFGHACRMATQMVNLKGIRLIVFDYLQQFTQSLGKVGGYSPYERVTYVSRGIKELAMTLNVPIIAVSSLSRAPANREDKWPMLSDLRESGNLESDADMVMFLYRPDYYFQCTFGHKRPERDCDSCQDARAGVGYITINKQRQGGHLRLGGSGEANNAIPIKWHGQKYVDMDQEERKPARMM